MDALELDLKSKGKRIEGGWVRDIQKVSARPEKRGDKMKLEKGSSTEDDLGYLLDQEWPGRWKNNYRFDGRLCLRCYIGDGERRLAARDPNCKSCKGRGMVGGRRWRLDFAWLNLRLGVEVDGGIWTHGRHTRGKGWEDDAEKLAEAAIQGWTVIRVSTGQVSDGRAMGWIRRLVAVK